MNRLHLSTRIKQGRFDIGLEPIGDAAWLTKTVFRTQNFIGELLPSKAICFYTLTGDLVNVDELGDAEKMEIVDGIEEADFQRSPEHARICRMFAESAQDNQAPSHRQAVSLDDERVYTIRDFIAIAESRQQSA